MAEAEGCEWTCEKVRQSFIDFFVKKQEHTFVPSSPVVPLNDPTLLFANAGMNQYKPIFLGQVEPSDKVLYGLKRASNSQKCIRAGGKHNDLEDVGKDVYHHTFFEMLGNWSFGDFFKAEAIKWSFQLLTEEWGIPAERLYVTYFGGDEAMGLESDEEAKELWLQYLPAERVLPFDKTDNFWEMGETGPCGPCSEIHYDRIGGRDAASLVNMDDPDVLEIWNLVFIQYNCLSSKPSKVLEKLPANHVDTGMGLERIVSVLQNKMSNYDTDIFGYIFEAIHKTTGTRPYTGLVTAAGQKPTHEEMIDMSYRVVADHIRTLSFALADGAKIGNNGRDYVLKRVCRRAVRYARQFLNAKNGFFSDLVPVVVANLGGFFPELKAKADQVQADIADDEASFYVTLDRGIKRFENFVKDMPEGSTVFSGDDAFMLSDTFGFPYDLTELMCEERLLTIDKDRFDARLEQQRSQSRKTAGEGVKELALVAAQTAELEGKGVPPTNCDAKYNWDATTCTSDTTFTSAIRAIWTGTEMVDSVTAQEEGDNTYGIVVDSSPFYYESGGQTSDIGSMTTANGEFRVLDVKKFGAYVLHIGDIVSGTISTEEEATQTVNYTRRLESAKNHTGTHLLNWALRQVMPSEADQQGSLVLPEKLRFDFTCPKAMKPDEISKVEQFVQESVNAALPINMQECEQVKAREISVLRTMFNEQYPDMVRVVCVGKPIDTLIEDPKNEDWKGYSVEFCGGTHLGNSSQIEKFFITKEESVSKGTRRIEAITGAYAQDAQDAYEELQALVQAAAGLAEKERLVELKALERRLVQTTLSTGHRGDIDKMLKSERKKLLEFEKAEKKKMRDKAVADVEVLANKLVGGTQRATVLELDGDKAILQDVIKAFQKIAPEIAIMTVGKDQSKNSLTVICETPKALQEALPANAWCDAAVSGAGGKGGGKADRAQGAAKDALDKAQEVCEAGVMFANNKLN